MKVDRRARGRIGWERPLLLGLAMAIAGCGGDSSEAERVPTMLGDSASAPTSGIPHAPVIEDVQLNPARPAPGRIVHARVRASDPDGDRPQIRYEWRTDTGRVLGSGDSLDTTGFEEGERLELVVVASDGERESEPVSTAFRLASTSVEIALVAIEVDETPRPGVVLEAVVESTNEREGGYDVLHEWIVDGRVVGTDDELDTTALEPGDVVVLAARLDFEDRTTDRVRSRPLALERGAAPRIVSKPQGGLEDGVFRYRMRAESDEPGAVFRYTAASAPEGLRVDEETGLVTWRPTPDQRGAFEIELVASDQWGTGIAQRFELRLESPTPPASAR